MNYPLMAMVQLGVVPPVTFPTDSRYYGFGVQYYSAPNGQVIAYLARRIVPQPGAPNFATINQYTVHQGDRLDLIAGFDFTQRFLHQRMPRQFLGEGFIDRLSRSRVLVAR